MTKSEIENRIKEIDRNIEMIFFKDILKKLEKERKDLLKLLKEYD